MLSVEQSITKTEQMMNDLIDIKETQCLYTHYKINCYKCILFLLFYITLNITKIIGGVENTWWGYIF
mgnify:CR=1 FL=1